MSNKKQTAVEWLVEQIKKDINLRLRGFDIDKALEQAKKIEKEQKIDFANNYGFDVCGYDYERAEQYYKEKFK